VDVAGKEIRTYRDLAAWQRAMDLAECTYRVTEALPPDERFGLVSQMRRAAASVSANIAEGHGRGHRVEFRRYLQIARGSLCEVQTYAELTRRLGWIKGPDLTKLRDLCHEVDAILAGLLRSLGRKPQAGGSGTGAP